MKTDGIISNCASISRPILDVNSGLEFQSLGIDLGLTDGLSQENNSLWQENQCSSSADPVLLCNNSSADKNSKFLSSSYDKVGNSGVAEKGSTSVSDSINGESTNVIADSNGKGSPSYSIIKLKNNMSSKSKERENDTAEKHSKRKTKRKKRRAKSSDDEEESEEELSDEDYLPKTGKSYRTSKHNKPVVVPSDRRLTRAQEKKKEKSEKKRAKNKIPSMAAIVSSERLGDLKIKTHSLGRKSKDRNPPLIVPCLRIKILPPKKKISHTCGDCGKSFSQLMRLQLHEKIHLNKKTFPCPDCNKKFFSQENLNKHLKTHSPPGKPYSCDHCSKTFLRPDSLANHVTMHTGERPYLCEVCGKKFTCPRYLLKHGRIHTGEKTFECGQCAKKFAWHESLVYHMKIHTGEKPYSCKDCGKRFLETRALEKHARTHSGEKPYQCSQCGKMFARQDSLVDHEKIHSDDKPFKCLECGKSFIKPRRLIKHQRIHNKEGGKRHTHLENLKGKFKLHETEDRPYECTDCGKRFSDAKGIVKHAKTHSGLKPYQCEQCGKQFLRNSTLTEHRRIHSGEKPYECKHCGRKFTIYSSLAIHRRRHSGEMPYCCKLCGEKFMWHTALVRHVKVHNGENPYPEKRKNPGSLPPKRLSDPNSGVPKVRRNQGAGDKPFKCTQCEKKFKTGTSLSRHAAKVHSATAEKLYECNWCPEKFSSHDVFMEHLRNHETLYDIAQRSNYGAMMAPNVLETINQPLLQQSHQTAPSPVLTTMQPPPPTSNHLVSSPIFNNNQQSGMNRVVTNNNHLLNHHPHHNQNVGRGSPIVQPSMNRCSPVNLQAHPNVSRTSAAAVLQSVGSQNMARAPPITLQSMNHPGIPGMSSNIRPPPIAHSYNNTQNYCTNFSSYNW